MKISIRFLVLIAFVGGPNKAPGFSNAESLCDLVENPAKYDGTRVTVTAVYNYGYEWQELVCMECRAKGKTWFALHPDAANQVRKQMKRAPHHQGIIRGRFSRVFHGVGGPYGDGSFRFEFEVEEVADLRVLVRNWKTPLDQVGTCNSTARRTK